MLRRQESRRFPGKVMRVEGLRTDLSLIIKLARRNAAARARVASFVTYGSRDEITMSLMYTSHSTGQCFSADRVIAQARCWHMAGEYFHPKGKRV